MFEFFIVISMIFIINNILYKNKNIKYNNELKKELRWLYLDKVDIDLLTMTWGKSESSLEGTEWTKKGYFIEKNNSLFYKTTELTISYNFNFKNKYKVIENGNINLSEIARKYNENHKGQVLGGNLDFWIEKYEDSLNEYEVSFEVRNKIIESKQKYKDLI